MDDTKLCNEGKKYHSVKSSFRHSKKYCDSVEDDSYDQLKMTESEQSKLTDNVCQGM
jgi:hypothetical protein